MNVALLLAMHLGFFVCAGLIVGPLLTDGAGQGESTIAVSQSTPGDNLAVDEPEQKKMAEVQFQGEFSMQRNWGGPLFGEQPLGRWSQSDVLQREARRPTVPERSP